MDFRIWIEEKIVLGCWIGIVFRGWCSRQRRASASGFLMNVELTRPSRCIRARREGGSRPSAPDEVNPKPEHQSHDIQTTSVRGHHRAGLSPLVRPLTMGSQPNPSPNSATLAGASPTRRPASRPARPSSSVILIRGAGLGPVFNNTSCAKCHDQGAIGGGSDTLETRYGQVIDGVFNPLTQFDGQLLHSKGIGLFNGVDFVGEVVPPEANVVAQRRTNPLFGLGLVDAVPDQILMDLAQFSRNSPPRRPAGPWS